MNATLRLITALILHKGLPWGAVPDTFAAGTLSELGARSSPHGIGYKSPCAIIRNLLVEISASHQFMHGLTIEDAVSTCLTFFTSLCACVRLPTSASPLIPLVRRIVTTTPHANPVTALHLYPQYVSSWPSPST